MRKFQRHVSPFLLSILLYTSMTVCNAQDSRIATRDASVSTQAAFYLKTNIPNKIPNDEIVLLTGETIQLTSGVLTPDPAFERPILFDYKRSLSKNEQLQTFRVSLDRVKGVVCLKSKCAQVSAICPPYDQLQRGTKCHAFPRREN
jgi:hypothetical protein